MAASHEPQLPIVDCESPAELRLCVHCESMLEPSDFPARSSRCRPCHRLYTRAHYRANLRYYKEKARKRQIKVIEESRRWIRTYLRQHPCIDCRTGDIRVLEFDHRDPSAKLASVAVLVGQGFNLDRVKGEVEKCDVRCADCHRIRTHEQLGWWGANEAHREEE